MTHSVPPRSHSGRSSSSAVVLVARDDDRSRALAGAVRARGLDAYVAHDSSLAWKLVLDVKPAAVVVALPTAEACECIRFIRRKRGDESSPAMLCAAEHVDDVDAMDVLVDDPFAHAHVIERLGEMMKLPPADAWDESTAKIDFAKIRKHLLK